MPSRKVSASTTDAWTVAEIVERARGGKIRIPHFQRSYVWDSKDVLKLLDSIYRGFPVGTLLLWKQQVPAEKVQFGPIWINAEEATDGLVVVDGQQRVTSLLGTLVRDFSPVDPRFQVYFNVRTEKFTGPIQGKPPARAVPVTELLTSKSLLAWLREYGEDFTDDELDKIDDLGAAIRDYKIPVYVVSEEDEDTLREVFDRVNEAGRPLSRAQIFHALTSARDAGASPQAVTDSLRHLGFGLIEENRVLQTLLGIRGGDVLRDVHDEFLRGDDPVLWYQRAEDALTRAIEFLRSTGVPHRDLLPNSLPLPIIAVFLDKYRDLDDRNQRLLEIWLWRSWIFGLGTGSGGQTPVLRKALALIRPRAGDTNLFQGSTQTEAFEDLRMLYGLLDSHHERDFDFDSFGTDKATSRIILLAMIDFDPLDANGHPINVAEIFEEHNPRDAIGSIYRGWNSRVGNRIIWPRPWPPILGVSSEAVLKTHFLEPADLMRAPEDVILQRRQRIEDALRGFIAARVDKNVTLRPSIDNLLVAD